MLALPLPILHHSELTSAQLFDESEVTGVNLPHTWSEQERMESTLKEFLVMVLLFALFTNYADLQEVYFQKSQTTPLTIIT